MRKFYLKPQLFFGGITLPGTRNGNQVDRVKFENWIEITREKCCEIGRSEAGDDRIGEMLAYSPAGEDGHWPCEPVRDLFEKSGTNKIGQAFTIGVFNSRGISCKAPYEGGQQERDLAQKYENYAIPLELTHPKTASLLREISEKYLRNAEREDLDAKLRDSEE